MCAEQGSATGTVLIENERVRTTEWCVPARGDNTGWHRHEYDYVVIPMQDGALDITGSDGAVSRSALQAGVPYFRAAGVEHDVASANDFPFRFIEVELLEPPK